MSIVSLISELCVIFLMVAIGFALRKKEMLSDTTVTGISALIVNVTNPCLLIDSALQYEGRLSIHDFLFALTWCAILYAILITAAYLIPAILRIEKDKRFAYYLLTIFGNTGYIGLPVCRALFGNSSVLYITINNILMNLLIYTYGTGVLQNAKRRQDQRGTKVSSDSSVITVQQPRKTGLSAMINVGTISSFIATLCYLFDPKVPHILSEVVSYTGDPTIFLSMVVLGSSVASAPIKEYLNGGKRVAEFLLLRMIVLPVVMVLIMKPFISDPIQLGTMTILVSLPGANLPLIMARKTGVEDGDLARGIILSTIVCIFTIPVVCLFL